MAATGAEMKQIENPELGPDISRDAELGADDSEVSSERPVEVLAGEQVGSTRSDVEEGTKTEKVKKIESETQGTTPVLEADRAAKDKEDIIAAISRAMDEHSLSDEDAGSIATKYAGLPKYKTEQNKTE